jgi:predicted deacylase
MRSIQVGTAIAAPNEKARGQIAAPMPNGSTVHIPVVVVNGCSEGPTLYVQAAQHGVEVNGAEAIATWADRLRPSELTGAFIGVPIANPLAALRTRRHFYQMRDGQTYGDPTAHQMNRCWPGDPDGNETERLVWALYNEALTQADYAIDLHAWELWMASAALPCGWLEGSLELGRLFGLRPVLVQDEPAPPDSSQSRLFHTVLCDLGVPAIAVELRGQRDMVRSSIQQGIRGLGNVLRGLGMIEGQPEARSDQIVVERRAFAESLVVVESPATGLIIPETEAGTEVTEGQRIAYLLDVEHIRRAPIHSPVHGYLYRLSRMVGEPDTQDQDMTPVLYEGDRLAAIYPL